MITGHRLTASVRHPRRHQSGSMTLLVGLVLLVGAGILTFSAGRTGVVEQRIANNEFRAQEAQQAAQAGLDYALAWLAENIWRSGDAEPAPPEITTSSGEIYRTALIFTKTAQGVCVRAQARATTEQRITASVRECVQQQGLFDPAATSAMPPPLVLAGCLGAPDETANLFLPDDAARSVMSGHAANNVCLPQGALSVSVWHDRNGNLVKDADEVGSGATYRRASFGGCPGDQCAWKRVFAMPLEDAKAAAIQAGHRFDDSIPCGATTPPGIYLIEHTRPIHALDISGSCTGAGVDNRTLGTPERPILFIVPRETGCPLFEPGISIHGMVYYESTTACAVQGWGGARIHGAVIWEGDAGPPPVNTEFIAPGDRAGSELNDDYQVIRGATRLPGTWRDWE